MQEVFPHINTYQKDVLNPKHFFHFIWLNYFEMSVRYLREYNGYIN